MMLGVHKSKDETYSKLSEEVKITENSMKNLKANLLHT